MTKKNPGWKMFFAWQLFKTLWSSLTFAKVKKYSQTSTAAVEPLHLKSKLQGKAYCPMYIKNQKILNKGLFWYWGHKCILRTNFLKKGNFVCLLSNRCHFYSFLMKIFFPDSGQRSRSRQRSRIDLASTMKIKI